MSHGDEMSWLMNYDEDTDEDSSLFFNNLREDSTDEILNPLLPKFINKEEDFTHELLCDSVEIVK